MEKTIGITEDYVSFEIAKLLKEKGFEGECSKFYESNGHGRWKHVDYHIAATSDRTECPTLQMAMKWLREIHKLFISIQLHMGGSYVWYIYRLDGTPNGCDRNPHNYSYEQACEAAIKYCLENLI